MDWVYGSPSTSSYISYHFLVVNETNQNKQQKC